jgi:hypothetical protein
MILSQSDLTYIQCSGDRPPFGLEYQDGSLDQHFECPTILDKSQLEQIFLWYLTDDPRWRALEWKKMML